MIEIKYGIRHGRTGEIWRDHYVRESQAQAWLDEWLEDGGLDVFEIVRKTITHSAWESID